MDKRILELMQKTAYDFHKNTLGKSEDEAQNAANNEEDRLNQIRREANDPNSGNYFPY